MNPTIFAHLPQGGNIAAVASTLSGRICTTISLGDGTTFSFWLDQSSAQVFIATISAALRQAKGIE